MLKFEKFYKFYDIFYCITIIKNNGIWHKKNILVKEGLVKEGLVKEGLVKSKEVV
jgi:hypothetical protein